MVGLVMVSKIRKSRNFGMSVMVEIIAGVCLIISALFFSNITGAVTGYHHNSGYGLAFLCIAIASVSMFLWIRIREGGK